MSNPLYVSAPALASYIGGSPESDQITQIANITNMLIDEEWAEKVTPVPARVLTVAFNVAVRAAANPKGLTSWTRSWDDITRTERVEGAREMGIYLTDAEHDKLNGIRETKHVVKSIRMVVPRWGF